MCFRKSPSYNTNIIISSITFEPTRCKSRFSLQVTRVITLQTIFLCVATSKQWYIDIPFYLTDTCDPVSVTKIQSVTSTRVSRWKWNSGLRHISNCCNIYNCCVYLSLRIQASKKSYIAYKVLVICHICAIT